MSSAERRTMNYKRQDKYVSRVIHDDWLSASMKIFELLKRKWKEKKLDEKSLAKVEADFQEFMRVCEETFKKHGEYSPKEMREKLPHNFWIKFMSLRRTNQFLLSKGETVSIAADIRERARKLRENDGRYTVH